ncbi:polyprenyl synthetase family protein [Nocardia brasiliensis]|uniref:polyprenyl synthetase family protein n=1 Tax=Nocardia brasiliensis TaxID=37326 RepID=UPI0024568F61|nr:polyprenyl synthetase family protein [Nocardia brasiliensis]
MAEYNFGWVDDSGMPTDPQERTLRRRSAVMSLVSAGSDRASWDRARNLAVANTLLWAALFIHDDIADRDETRYGRATVWKTFGTDMAVHLGDALLAQTFQILNNEPDPLRTRLVSLATSVIATVCSGQAAEAALQHTRAGLAHVFSVYDRKASSGFAYCLSSGAVCVGADNCRIDAASRLGAKVALAFQLRNDLASIWDDEDSGLKDPLSDLRERKLTAIMAFALTQQGNAADKLREFYQQPPAPDTAILYRARIWLEQCGAKTWLEAEIDRQTQAALRLVPYAAADPNAREELRSLVHHFCDSNECP